MGNFILNILSLGTKPLYDRHMKFDKLISEFRIKLANPEYQKKSTASDIDQLYNELNSFNSHFVFFKKYYQKYINNLNRLKPDPEDKNPDWTLLQIAVAKNKWKPTTPFSIFVHHIKYDYVLTSKPFIAYQKKQNRKKLNKPVKVVKETEKPKSEKEWIRVPISRNKSKP